MHFSEITTTKFRGCSTHGKSFRVFKSHFPSQTFILFAIAKRKGPATRASVRNASEGVPAKLQSSHCASVKFKGKDPRSQAIRVGVSGLQRQRRQRETRLAEAEPHARGSWSRATTKRRKTNLNSKESEEGETAQGRGGEPLPYRVNALNGENPVPLWDGQGCGAERPLHCS